MRGGKNVKKRANRRKKKKRIRVSTVENEGTCCVACVICATIEKKKQNDGEGTRGAIFQRQSNSTALGVVRSTLTVICKIKKQVLWKLQVHIWLIPDGSPVFYCTRRGHSKCIMRANRARQRRLLRNLRQLRCNSRLCKFSRVRRNEPRAISDWIASINFFHISEFISFAVFLENFS